MDIRGVAVAVAVVVIRTLAIAPAPAYPIAPAPVPTPGTTHAPAPASLYFHGVHATLRCALEALWYLTITRDGVHGCVPPMRAHPSDLIAVVAVIVVVAALRSHALLLIFVESHHLYFSPVRVPRSRRAADTGPRVTYLLSS